MAVWVTLARTPWTCWPAGPRPTTASSRPRRPTIRSRLSRSRCLT